MVDQSKKAVVIRHVAFEDLGYFETILKDLDYSVTYLEAGRDNLNSIQVLNPELLVICGGPISVNEEHLYPFLHDEFRIVEKRIQSKKPTLGLCLGAQIIAKVLGSRVYSLNTKEIGWSPIDLTKEGKQSSLRHLAHEDTHVFHWHGETFDLPSKGVLLASTSICKNQAFTVERHTLALQFHPEITPLELERWYIGHTCELNQWKQVSIDQLRKDSNLWGKKLRAQGGIFMKEWVLGLDS